MDDLPESPEALRLQCILLQNHIEVLKAQLRLEQNKNRYIQKLQKHFWTWISDRRNYITWRSNTKHNGHDQQYRHSQGLQGNG